MEQFHTHNDYSGPTRIDAAWSQNYGIPVNVFNLLGEHWRFYYDGSAGAIPFQEFYGYGEIIN